MMKKSVEYKAAVSDDMTKNNIGKNIQSVQRAIDILNCFNEQQVELSLSEISKMLGINKSTLHGIMNTLHNNGYLRQNEERKYLLGPLLLAKSRYLIKTERSFIISLAKPHMMEISNKYKCTANLFVVSDGRAIFSYQVIPTSAKYTLTHVSDISPLYTTATGKLTLGHMADEELKDYLESLNIEKISRYTVGNRNDLCKEIQKIRTQGFSYENQELVEGVSAISIPIYNRAGEWVAALSIVDIAVHVTKTKDALVQSLKKSSQEISQKII